MFVLTLYLAGDNKGLSPHNAALSVLKQLKIKCMLASSRCELYNTTGRYKAFCCGLSSFHINLTLWQSLLNSEACQESQYILIFVRRADPRFTPSWVSPTLKFYSNACIVCSLILNSAQVITLKKNGSRKGVIQKGFITHKSVQP